MEYRFPGSQYTTKTLSFTWFDGTYAPNVSTDEPDLQLSDGKQLPKQGAMFIGENGNRIMLPHVAGPQFLPRSLLEQITKPELEPINHYHQWIDACLGKGECSTAFDYARILTSTVLLGVLGNRFPGTKLKWNGKKMQFTNNDAANKLLSRNYRTDY